VVFDSRICRRNGRSDSRLERAGSTPTAQPARSRQAIPINSRSRRFGNEGEIASCKRTVTRIRQPEHFYLRDLCR